MKDVYSINVSNTTIERDADIRGIVNSMLYGTATERPRGRFLVLQNIVRDSAGNPVKSPYVYKATGEGKDANRGPATTRTGYLCSEKLVRGKIMPAGRRMIDEFTVPMGQIPAIRDLVILSASDPVIENDIVIEIRIDDNGDPVQPITIQSEFIVTKVYLMTSDYGRVEYIVAVVEKEK